MSNNTPNVHRRTVSLLAIAALLAVGSALVIQNQRAGAQIAALDDEASPFANIQRVVAVLHPTAGNEAHGVVFFTQQADHVLVEAQVEGLEPNSRHGFHIHEFGDCTADDATSAGGHYNPEGHPHGLPNAHERHAGDLGNLEANAEGVGELVLVAENITLAGDHNPILGRGLIVHEGEDDGSQPLGDAGPRIACGVLGVAQE